MKEVRVTKWLSGGRMPQEEENRQCILTINFQMNEPTHFRNTKVLTSLINVSVQSMGVSLTLFIGVSVSSMI